ncbi:MAG: alpha/beta hydrolase [Candidatus Micrarchaeota archaeon]
MELKSTDGLKLAATYYKSASGGREALILLHMLGRNRNDWAEFAKRAQATYDVIAVDFRGHGDSEGEIASFTEKDYLNFKLDALAAADYLDKQGKKVHAIIGASIGANIALMLAAEKKSERAVLLSPGLDYRGVKTEEHARIFMGKLLLVASDDDAYSANSTRKLYSMSLAKKQLKIYQTAGHGTHMFASTDLEELILDWLRH